jgi:transposase-like protein
MSERIPITRLTAFFKAFANKETCMDYLLRVIYPNGFTCPKCGNKKYGRVKGRRAVQCSACSHQVSVTAGTVMHGSHIPLFKWLLAIFLVTHDKRGYSAMSLAHEIKVSRRSAAYLLERLRSAMALKAMGEVLDTWVEIDDAFIGSKGTTRGRGTEKAQFIVAAQKTKGGGVCIRATESLKGGDYKEFARWHIGHSARITSDGYLAIGAGLSSYSGLEAVPFDAADETHSLPTVHHIISNFKAHIAGTYHGVHRSHLQSYMDEFSYRYNNRLNADVFHTLLTDVCLSTKRTRARILELFVFQNLEALKQAA